MRAPRSSPKAPNAERRRSCRQSFHGTQGSGRCWSRPGQAPLPLLIFHETEGAGVANRSGTKKRGRRQLADEAASESLLFGRHFCRRAIHHIEIPWPIDRDKKQVSVGPNPCLVNHFARHVVVATRT